MPRVPEDWRERCYPDDGWNDEAPGLIRVHVAQARMDVLIARHSKRQLVRMAQRRGGIRLRGNKRDLAWALVLAGEKP